MDIDINNFFLLNEKKIIRRMNKNLKMKNKQLVILFFCRSMMPE